MKRFTQFLLEQKMDREEAMRILGLKPGFSTEDLNVAWKKAARENHPDRGGNLDKMKDINNAKDALQGTTQAAAKMASYEQAKAQTEEKAEVFEKLVMDSMKEHLDLDKFVQHFNRVFSSEHFKVVKSQWWDSFKSKNYSNRNNIFTVHFEAEFANETRTIVLDMSISANYHELFNTRALAGPEAFVSMFIMSDILYNRKKVKLTQSNYKRMDTSNVLSDPEVLFPAKKLKSQATKSTGRALSKRDVLLTLEKELGAGFNGEWAFVPIGDFEIAMWRAVFSFRGERAATWSIHSVRGPKPKREKFQVKHTSYSEDAETMTWFLNHLRRLKDHPPATPQALVSDLDAMASENIAKRAAKKATDQ
jgi:curved DNA-binding protein CbpA